MLTENSKVYYIKWKDKAFILIISFILLSNNIILSIRKRPKETSSKAKTLRAPFSDEAVKELKILVIIDKYNYFIGIINKFNHLIA